VCVADSSPQASSSTVTKDLSPMARPTPNTPSPGIGKDSTGRLVLHQAPSTRIKINFKIPFEQAQMSKKCLSPYFPFNPYKEVENGKAIFKSPLVKKSMLLSIKE